MLWQQPNVLVLAPMDDVTDVVFREVLAELAPPDIFFTEFTNCDALASAGRAAHLQRLKYTQRQRPIVAQLWGVVPQHFQEAARLCRELGFDGIDLNMGCPDKNVIKAGACSALIHNRSLAKEIIEATKAGAGALPVSVKTRLGIEQIETDEWIGWLLDQSLAAITIHGRTVRELSRVPAHWEEIAKAVQMKRARGVTTAIIGNGDITSYEQAQQYIKVYGVDGVMIGRGLFENPFIFHPTKTIDALSVPERLRLYARHITLWLNTWGVEKHADILKKFMRVYVSGFPGAQQMRTRLAAAKSASELLLIVQGEEQSLSD